MTDPIKQWQPTVVQAAIEYEYEYEYEQEQEQEYDASLATDILARWA